MEPVTGNDTNALRPKYETRTFNPRSAFSWTLRAGEIARLEARRQRDGAGEPRPTATVDHDAERLVEA